MRPMLFTVLFAVMVVAGSAWGQDAPARSKEQEMSHEQRIAWWREARFGMFIHWGVYAVPAGRWEGKVGGGEWIMEHRHIPVSQYEPLAGQFTAARYDPAQWAKLAREAGMKYIVITSKHHDGFALWDSKLSDWDVMRTPHKNDLLAPLAEATRNEGLHFGLYHSIMDWHHPDYIPRRQWNDLAKGDPDFARFREYLFGQVEEIVTNYEPDILWFDGEWENTWTHDYGKELESHVRKLKPDILINNRVGKAREGMAGLDKEGLERLGDFGTPEQEIPSTGLPGVDWESCMTMNGTWGYMVDDLNWKSTSTLIRNLIECASKGGNYLLNVGPTSEGEIPEASADRLRGIGKWMQVNGEAIYGTTAGPFKRLPWGRATRKGDVLYLHVFEWPREGSGLVVPLRNSPEGAWLLAGDGRELPVWQGAEGGIAISGLPAEMPDENATVIALRIKGEPDVLPTPTAAQADDGMIVLEAKDADITGAAHLENIDGQSNVGYWTQREGTVSWDVRVEQPGRFDVEIEFACEEPSAGSRIAIVSGDSQLEWQVPSTGGWQKFQTARLGQMQVAAGDMVSIRVEARQKPGHGVMNLRRLILTPVR